MRHTKEFERVQAPEQIRESPTAVQVVLSIVLLLALAILANRLSQIGPRALEFPLWAAALGLGANLLVSLVGLKTRLSAAFRTELFLKVGLVLLGTGVNFADIMSVGFRGLIQACIMVVAVFAFTWWLGSVFRLDTRLKAVMATAVSVCGVSAAIVAAGSILAKKEHLAYVTALVIATALPLMVLMPWMASGLQMSPEWAGGWFGGNIDTTAAVVGAGTLYGESAVKVASIVKMSQNALLGLVAFLLALYAVVKEGGPGGRPQARVIWERFPKFVLGFMAASILASIGLFSREQLVELRHLRDWFFVLAFIGIGWELTFGELRKMGGRPVAVYAAATVFNTVLAFAVAWLLFG